MGLPLLALLQLPSVGCHLPPLQEYASFIKQVESDAQACCCTGVTNSVACSVGCHLPPLQEYASFIKQVESDAQAAAAQQAEEEDQEATGRLEREDFEQL